MPGVVVASWWSWLSRSNAIVAVAVAVVGVNSCATPLASLVRVTLTVVGAVGWMFGAEAAGTPP